MKFSQYPYKRPDFIKAIAQVKQWKTQFVAATSSEEQVQIIKQHLQLEGQVDMARSLAGVRSDLNAKDTFYQEEVQFLDQQMPIFKNEVNNLECQIVQSSYRKELEKEFGKQFFTILDQSTQTINKKTISIDQELGKLTNTYMEGYSQSMISYEGKKLPMGALFPFMTDKDRAVRIKAKDAYTQFSESVFEKNADLFGQLVQKRHEKAQALGYENYIPLRYLELSRSDYTQKQVEQFRKHIKTYFIPIALELRERRRKHFGVDFLDFYDSGLKFKDGNPKPKGSIQELLVKAGQMFKELSSETDHFFQSMVTNELMDVETREGKYPGGYNGLVSVDGASFILANFNGTSSDIQVLTHEVGHALQTNLSKEVAKKTYYYYFPTTDIAEIHSTAMELFTLSWQELFFEEKADKFRFAKISGQIFNLLDFCTGDEFQQFVYEHPHCSTEERSTKYAQIEKSYYPYLTKEYYHNQGYYIKGKSWVGVPHFITMPFYYIDYGLASICALQLWQRSQTDFKGAWKDYVNLCKAGGSRSYFELLEIANLQSPFEEETIASVAGFVKEWLDDDRMIA